MFLPERMIRAIKKQQKEEKSIIYDGMIRREKKKRFRFRLEPEALLYRYNNIKTKCLLIRHTTKKL